MYTKIIEEQFKQAGIEVFLETIHSTVIRDIYEFSVPGKTKIHLILEVEELLKNCIPEVRVSIRFPLSIEKRTIGVVVFKKIPFENVLYDEEGRYIPLEIEKMSNEEFEQLVCYADFKNENPVIAGIRFDLTCGQCPEQYDLFKDGVQVGYVHLRGGDLYVSVPDAGLESKVIYSHHFDGEENQWKGCFDSKEERARFFVDIANAVNKWLEDEKSKEGEIYQLYLTKSRYINALQCPKMLWLKDHKPELLDDSVINERILKFGNEVGDLAKGLFGEYKEIPYGKPSEMAKETYKSLNYSQAPEVITEASFMQENCLYKNFCSVDVLRKTTKEKDIPFKSYELNEVKSSTAVKDVYMDDLAFQKYVAYHANTDCFSELRNIEKTNLVHINNQYVRHGKLELDKLFTVEDVSEEVHERFLGIEKNISELREFMKQKDEPEHEIGPHCFYPYPCGFWSHCAAHLPSPNIFDIRGSISGDKWDYLRKGVVTFEDAKNAGILYGKQLLQVDYELGNLPPYLDKESIRAFLKDITYPLYFLDFETFQSAIPLYDNSRPYQQIPFQYSLHWIEHEGGEIKHTEYLAYPGYDPRRELAERLCNDIPKNVCTTAYNMSFEKGKIRELAALFPDLSDHLMNIHDNIRDLMIPFKYAWYYCKAMHGSYSIKDVLPALFPDDPELDYSNLEGVHHGGEAMEMFAAMQNMAPEELEKNREYLLKYCCLDTYAMVKIWEKLREVSE